MSSQLSRASQLSRGTSASQSPVSPTFGFQASQRKSISSSSNAKASVVSGAAQAPQNSTRRWSRQFDMTGFQDGVDERTQQPHQFTTSVSALRKIRKAKEPTSPVRNSRELAQ